MTTEVLNNVRTVVDRPRSYLWTAEEASFPAGALIKAGCERDSMVEHPELAEKAVKRVNEARLIRDSQREVTFVVSVDLAITALLVGQVIAFCMITTAYIFARVLGG